MNWMDRLAAFTAPGEAPRASPDIPPKRNRPTLGLRCRSAPFMDPPVQLQRLSRRIGPRVQVLNFLSRFSMGNFKNRLAARNRAQTDRHASQASPRGRPVPPGGPGRRRGPYRAFGSSVRGRGRRGGWFRRVPAARLRGAGQGWSAAPPLEAPHSQPHCPPPSALPPLSSPPLHRPAGADAEALAQSRPEGPGSGLFFSIYYGKF